VELCEGWIAQLVRRASAAAGTNAAV